MNIDDLIERDQPYCAPADTLQQAAERICLWQCDSLPVCDAERRLVGSITSRDVCQCACVTGEPLAALRVAQALQARPLFGRLLDPCHVLLDLMVREQVWQLPLVDEADRLVGVVRYQRLLRGISGARDVMVIVPEAGSLDAGIGGRAVPTWTLVAGHRELIRPDGESVQLSGAEARLLLALAESRGAVLDREVLTRIVLQRSWDPTDRYVDVVVANLRRKFRERASDARAIRTVPNEGYVLTLTVIDQRQMPCGSSRNGDTPQRPRHGQAAAARRFRESFGTPGLRTDNVVIDGLS